MLDPERSVPISSDSETNTNTSSGGAGGAVTVASNLPDTGDSAGGGQNNTNQSQSRERINYEISETVRERVQLPGDIARLSVAVLINHETVVGPDGETTTAPRSEVELTAFQALVQSAVGFNAERGDVITIETMQFPEPPILGSVASSGILSGYAFNIQAMLQMAVLGIVTLALGMFVVKPILTNPTPQLNQLAPEPIGALASTIGTGSTERLSALSEVPAIENSPKDPVDILRETIAQRSEESGHLLRNWIEVETQQQKEQVT